MKVFRDLQFRHTWNGALPEEQLLYTRHFGDFLRKSEGVWIPGGRCVCPGIPDILAGWRAPFHCSNYYSESCWKGLWAIIRIIPRRITFTNVIAQSFRGKWHHERAEFHRRAGRGGASASGEAPLSDANWAKRQCKANLKIFRSPTSLFWASGHHRLLSNGASKSKFMRWMLSEARQTKTVEFGAKKGLQGRVRTGGSCSKKSWTTWRVLAERF